MYVLGIETSSKVMALGVADEDRVLGEICLNIGLTHGQQLLPAIEQLLTMLQMEPRELGGVGVSTGPGSFTGLRIGVSTAKAFAQGLSLPVCGISTFEALAANFPGSSRLICPLFDARRGQVYVGLYRYEQQLVSLLSPRAMNLDELIEYVRSFSQGVIFVGDGVDVFGHQLEEKLPGLAYLAPPEVRQVRGGTVACLAQRRLVQGEKDDLFTLQPQYLRKSEAELCLLANTALED